MSVNVHGDGGIVVPAVASPAPISKLVVIEVALASGGGSLDGDITAVFFEEKLAAVVAAVAIKLVSISIITSRNPSANYSCMGISWKLCIHVGLCTDRHQLS